MRTVEGVCKISTCVQHLNGEIQELKQALLCGYDGQRRGARSQTESHPNSKKAWGSLMEGGTITSLPPPVGPLPDHVTVPFPILNLSGQVLPEQLAGKVRDKYRHLLVSYTRVSIWYPLGVAESRGWQCV